MDFQVCLRSLISLAQKVIPAKEYGINQPLAEYTKAVLSKLSTKSSGNKYKNVTLDDIRYGFMSLYVLHSAEITSGDITWLSAERPIFLTIRNQQICAYPLTHIYASTTDSEDLKLFTMALLSGFSNALGTKQGDQKDAITENIKKMFPDITDMLGKNDVDVSSVMSDINSIMSRLSTLTPPDLGQREDVVSAIIETLQQVEHDSELNSSIHRILKLGNNQKLMHKLPDMVTKMLPSLVNTFDRK